MSWIQVYDATFFLALCGSLMAALALSIKYCHRSKCSEVDLCCLHIKRDIKSEVELEEHELQNHETKEENTNNV